MFRILSLLIVFAVALLPAAEASGATRLALVIGNGAYATSTPLANPVNDARQMSRALRELGFTVVDGFDLDKRSMEALLNRFARQAGEAEVAVFYYAGHGASFDNAAYVVPTDATFEHEATVRRELIALDEILGDLRRASGVRIAILDACRDNRAEQQLKRRLAKERGTALTRGLAPAENPNGLLIAYATQPRAVAADGDGGRNSPFTAALLRHIDTPGLDVRLVLAKVKADVYRATSEAQLPEVSDSLIGEFSFRPAGPAAQSDLAAPAAEVPAGDRAAELAAWQQLKDSDDPAAVERFARAARSETLKIAAEARSRELRSRSARLDATGAIVPGEAARAVIDFDALDARSVAGGASGGALNEYLARFGVRHSLSSGKVYVGDDRNIYEGKAVRAPSGHNVLAQEGGNPVAFTLEFSPPVRRVTFTRVGLVAGPSGITHPQWEAVGYGAQGRRLAVASEEEIRSYTDVAPKRFALEAEGIARLTITGDHRKFAAFANAVLDDFVLERDR